MCLFLCVCSSEYVFVCSPECVFLIWVCLFINVSVSQDVSLCTVAPVYGVACTFIIRIK